MDRIADGDSVQCWILAAFGYASAHPIKGCLLEPEGSWDTAIVLAMEEGTTSLPKTEADVEDLQRLALESRERVKDHLARIDSTYPDVGFSYPRADGAKFPVPKQGMSF